MDAVRSLREDVISILEHISLINYYKGLHGNDQTQGAHRSLVAEGLDQAGQVMTGDRRDQNVWTKL